VLDFTLSPLVIERQARRIGGDSIAAQRGGCFVEAIIQTTRGTLKMKYFNFWNQRNR
jgi:hypothetical protein